MTQKKAPFTLIMTLFALTALWACNNGTANESAIVKPVDTGKADSTCLENIASDEPDTSITSITSTTSNTSTKPSAPQKTVSPNYGGKETLYISTYGANGKVWGHVTMNGKTGRGTIHDDDENTYTITVTRHGGELYGTDQNGRQYVFRL